MSYSIAPAATAALRQASALWPKRSRAGDGLIGDAAHRSRRSWHNPSDRHGNPTPNGVVLAFDLTHDPANGCDAHALVRAAVARGDRRVSEAISRGRIWTRARASEGWRPYGGANAHDHHAHVTVAWEHRTDTGPWWVIVPDFGGGKGTTAPRTPAQEDDDTMTPAQEAKLDEILDILKALVAPRLPGGKDRDPQHVDLADVLNDDGD